MKSFSKRVTALLERDFIDGTVYRVDLDRVDVAPDGSPGLLRSLPLAGDREKIQPGDPVKVINVGGGRIALAGDVALAEEGGETVEDASGVALEERLSQISPGGESRTLSIRDLADVDLDSTPPAHNDALAWDEVVEKFVPKAPAAGTDADTLDGYHASDFVSAVRDVYALRAHTRLQGGGAITITGQRVKWSERFIVISQGRGTGLSTSGYFVIEMPAAGTVITGVGGATDVTVTADGIELSGYTTLYYILPIGGSANTVNANFRVAHYSADLSIPATWVPLFSYQGEIHGFYGPNGIIMQSGQTLDLNTYRTNTLDGKCAGDFMGRFTAPGATIAGGGGAMGIDILGQEGGAAGFSLHRPGAFAGHFGLDTDNQLKWGGWSMGSAAYKIHHDGNCGVVTLVNSPAWTGLTGSLNLGNQYSYVRFNNFAIISGWFGSSGNVQSTYMTTYINIALRATFAGMIWVVNTDNNAIAAAGQWNATRLYMPTFNWTNFYANYIAIARINP